VLAGRTQIDAGGRTLTYLVLTPHLALRDNRRQYGPTGLAPADILRQIADLDQVVLRWSEDIEAGRHSGDIDILNIALGLEHEAIAAYQVGAQSGLLQKPVLAVAVQFQGHHKGHRDALIGAITKLGGTPVQPKSMNDYAMSLGAASIKSQADILHLAQRLERGAANAYLGVIPSFQDRAFAQVSARLAADEVMHWTALTGALGEALPTMPLTFGG